MLYNILNKLLRNKLYLCLSIPTPSFPPPLFFTLWCELMVTFARSCTRDVYFFCHGEILLEELVAILIALEHILQCSDSLPSKLLKIFSDSQSEIGILTLNWKDTSYKDVTKDICQATKSLQEKGVTVDISWTPSHASISGNEVADKLAKEAANEASQLPNDKRYTTFMEIREASRKTQITRWQTKSTPQNKEGHTTHSSPVLTGKECLISQTGKDSVTSSSFRRGFQNSKSTGTSWDSAKTTDVSAEN